MGVKRRQGDRSSRIAPEATPPERTDDLPPAFAFDQLRSGFDIPNCQTAGKSKELLDALARRSKLSWRDLIIGDYHKLAAKKLEQSVLSKDPIPGMTPDQKLLVFRFASNSGRFYGYKNGRIFHILWIDTKLKLTSH